MNILIINHYAGSEFHGMEFRHFYLSKELIKKGHDVMIVAADYSHLRRNNPNINGTSYKIENIDGINYFWIKTPKYKSNSILRILNIIVFNIKLAILSNKIIKLFNPNKVISSSTYTLDIWPSHYLAKKANCNLIYEIHDLWPLSPIEIGGYSKRHPYIMLIQAAEDFAYKNSDSVISILPNVSNYLELKKYPLEKLHIVPNGIDKSIIDTTDLAHEETLNQIKAIKRNSSFIVGYIGSHGKPNALDDLLQSACMLKNYNISFVLIGNGMEKNFLMELSQNMKLNNIYFIDPIPKETVIGTLKKFDVAYIGWKKHPIYKFGISPNKIFDYMISETPIIHAAEPENNIVDRAECGITVNPESPEEISNAILKIKNEDQSTIERMGENGKKYALKNHSYEHLTELFINAISK